MINVKDILYNKSGEYQMLLYSWKGSIYLKS